MTWLRSGVRSRLAVPWSVWALTAGFAGLLCVYAVVLPVYRAPDEPQHLDMIRKVREGYGYPELSTSFISQQVTATLPLIRFSEHSRHLTEDEARPRPSRPSFEEIAIDEPSRQPNPMPKHPPLYYTVAALETTALSIAVPDLRGSPFDREVLLYRFLNILFAVPLPFLAFRTSARLGLSRGASLTVAAVPLAVPMLAHIGGSVTSDNLLTLLFSVDALLLVGVWRGDLTRRTAVAVGVVTGLALLTKAFALLLLPWIGLAYLRGSASARSSRALKVGLAALAVAVAVGGWWWVRTAVMYGSVTPARGLRPSPADGVDTDLWLWISRYLEWMNARFWGWFGWVDVRLPEAATSTATVLLLVGGVTAVAIRRGDRTRVEAGFLVFPAVALFVLVAYNSLSTYSETGFVDSGIQGRYLFHALVPLSVASVAGYARIASRAAGFFPPVVLVGGGILHGISLTFLLRAFWGEEGASTREQVAALAAWSPLPQGALITVGAFAACGIASAGVAVLVEAWNHGHSATIEPTNP